MYIIEYENQKIPCLIQKAKIKNMYIHIKSGKVIVKAPIKLKDKKIYEFLEQKSKWIYQKLKQEKERIKDEKEIKECDIKRLQNLVAQYIDKYSKILKISPNKVRIKEINYAWGSCSSKKNITINLKLANKEEEQIEYVVLHEMCHLIQMNHSKDFWSLVKSNMENYKDIRKKLK